MVGHNVYVSNEKQYTWLLGDITWYQSFLINSIMSDQNTTMSDQPSHFFDIMSAHCQQL